MLVQTLEEGSFIQLFSEICNEQQKHSTFHLLLSIHSPLLEILSISAHHIIAIEMEDFSSVILIIKLLTNMFI